MNRKVSLLAIGVAALLTSCTVGPQYSKPSVPAAPSFREQPPASYKSVDGWKPAQPSDTILRPDWWKLFNCTDLNALEEQVEPSNQNLKVAEANFNQARQYITVNKSYLAPTIGTGPYINDERFSNNRPSTVASGFTSGDFYFPADISYELDLWGRIRRTITAAKESFQATAADLESVKLSLHAELATDYFEARALDREKQLLDDTVAQYQKALTLTQNRYEGGISSKAEVAQAQTQLNQAQAEDIDVGVARAQYEHAIAVLIGKNPESFTMQYEPMQGGPPVVPVGIPSQLLERRPDIASAERHMAALNEQIGIAQAAYYPTISITASGGFEGTSLLNWFTWPSRFWSVGPQTSEVLFDHGLRRARVNITQYAYEGAVASYRQAALSAFQQVEDQLSGLRILEQEAAKSHEATQAAETSLQLETNRYKGGLITFLDVVTAQNIALQNERTEVDVQRRRMDATISLIMALGGGWDTSKLPVS
jgi:NodT family efflux transporter outer membrane factor (OMF) lipoprotein